MLSAISLLSLLITTALTSFKIQRPQKYTILLPGKHVYNICTMLNQRRRRWADVVQMLYKCFGLAGYAF